MFRVETHSDMHWASVHVGDIGPNLWGERDQMKRNDLSFLPFCFLEKTQQHVTR